jgi:2-keto-4-pentenoate hydratase/2-oxohepta-3-ene-1,7-dioic acid hydratase in catechol pathway
VLEALFGYCAADGNSARDLQMRTSQWLMGRSCGGFLPIGPVTATANEVGDPQTPAVRSFANGAPRQDSSTGDILCTGTPEGVAMGMAGTPWLQPGKG